MQLARFAGRAVSVLMLATLAILEPFARFILLTLATLGMCVTIMFGFLIGAHGFAKCFMLAMSLGCLVLLGAYYMVMSILARVSNR
jgi:hypothetical protein